MCSDADSFVKLPAQVNDESLEQDNTATIVAEQPGHMAYAIQLFKLARINSEMKYVLHSVNRETPSYAFPAIRDILQWQDTANTQLAEWYANIPRQSNAQSDYGELLCKTQYHTMNMLLFLPTPGIPQPSPQSLRNCYRSSISAIKLFKELYSKDLLVYNWSTCHAVILHAFCLIYCVTTVAQLREETSAETLLTSIRAASDILSATGEYWAGAKKSRDLLNDLANRTLLRDLNQATARPDAMLSDQVSSSIAHGDASNGNLQNGNAASAPAYQVPHHHDDGIGSGNLSQGLAWEQQDLSFLFDGLPYGNNADGYDFDISSLFVDAVNISGNTGDSNIRFTF